MSVKSTKTSWFITIVAVIGMLVMYFLQDKDIAQGEYTFRPVSPLTSKTKPTQGREMISISEVKALKPNQMIDISEYPVGEINIQKLTENSYWIMHNLHVITMYIGEKEVLLVDAPEDLFADRLLKRIAKLTDNPVTTLVYSHPHLDHIGGAQNLVDALAKKQQSLKIIATDQFVKASTLYKQKIPQPTEIIPTPVGYFEFDNKKFKVGTPMTVAHSIADSYILFPDKIITFIDFIYAGRLPLHGYSGVQNMTGYVNFLRHVAGEDWIFANTGHNNVSSPQDLDFMLQYTKDIYDAWFRAINDNWGLPEYLRGKVKGDYVAVWLRNVFDKVAFQIAKELEPKYGHYPQFELAIDHALKVQWDGFLHYDFTHHPDIRPDFSPIDPLEPLLVTTTNLIN
ncbi:MBL fold metallo-hydrolase [Tenacibaculum sp. M341]|uniref:MBL fold metallo-hydrolase n=1 Tax=Tenacibaculum sp. M341 TaxID=2530339 RepID=UPI001045CB9A|nr:MBL fold metallo-hydrolase [Tenacibaculum sp. M341]TCI93152.1 MBL fold metallo-hydrolase [Tenacibaculum sp. M341]